MTDAINDPQKRIELMRENINMMTAAVPWARETGFQVTKIEPGHIWGVQPYKEHLIGDPEAGVIHGGVITTLLDNLCGMSCTTAMQEFRFVATLDLRIDYMRPAEPKQDILAEAECYHLTRSVAFCRAWAYHETRDKVIATAQGAFAINKARPKGSMPS
ncbi:MAG: PaaI family thioesterase [Henriciella sp.]|nr:PaaI family thioesterase [Henriciella sp.]